jgi:hypothetical protein
MAALVTRLRQSGACGQEIKAMEETTKSLGGQAAVKSECSPWSEEPPLSLSRSWDNFSWGFDSHWGQKNLAGLQSRCSERELSWKRKNSTLFWEPGAFPCRHSLGTVRPVVLEYMKTPLLLICTCTTLALYLLNTMCHCPLVLLPSKHFLNLLGG